MHASFFGINDKNTKVLCLFEIRKQQIWFASFSQAEKAEDAFYAQSAALQACLLAHWRVSKVLAASHC